jgi:hypothetical protein
MLGNMGDNFKKRGFDMAGVKVDCKNLVPLLAACAQKCNEYVRDIVPKDHCIKPAQEVVKASKNMITVCRNHIKECKDSACIAVCKSLVSACEKAVEKSTACVDVCMGAGTDKDAQEVCQTCAQACRDCIKFCNDCLAKACS